MPPMRDMRPLDHSIKIGPALGKTFRYMKKYLPFIVFAMVCAAGATVLSVVGPRLLGHMTDIMKDGLISGIDMAAIARMGFFLLAVYLGSAALSMLQQYMMAAATLRISKQMRGDLDTKINRVPMVYFSRNTQGDILSRITNDVSTVQQGLANSLPGMLSSLVQFVGCLVMMLVIEIRMAGALILLTFLGFAITMILLKRSQKYFVARQKNLGALNGYIEEMYTCHEIMRTSRAERQVRDRFGTLNDAVYDANWKSQFISGVMQPVMMVIGNLSYVTVCVLGAVLVLRGEIRFGVIVSFILYTRMFTQPLSQIAQSMTALQSVAAAATRIFDFLENEELSDESEKPAREGRPVGAVTFDHVRFAYPDHPDRIIIKDFCADIKPGQKVAIVGPTGAGKTTMVNLLMRFYEINEGRILIDGVSTKDMRREDIHDMFGMVLQDTWMFEGTVRENLCFNLEGVTEEKLERVAKACGISHFIHSLPQGFDTVLSESTTISAGQKQLFTIARAMLQANPMIILDEATSSVDTRTEQIIQDTMERLTVGRTCFIIAHRLSTIKNADLILVMNEGDVIEKGTHEELLAKGGFYAKLYNAQFEQAEALA